MKKIIALLLALVMMLSLTACGAKETPVETTAAPRCGSARGNRCSRNRGSHRGC